jgi:hypothetical protein
MDPTTRIDRILGLIRKLERRAGQMQQGEGAVSRLDLDMSLRDTRELYDLLLSLDAAPDTPPATPEETPRT